MNNPNLFLIDEANCEDKVSKISPEAQSVKKAKKAGKNSGTPAKKAPLKLIYVASPVYDYLFVNEEGGCRPLVEKDLRARIPGFDNLPERKRRRKANKLINKSVRTVVKLGNVLNAPKYVEEFDGTYHNPAYDDYCAGAHALLTLPRLFPGGAGLRLLDAVICGLQASSLTEQFPGLKLHLYCKDVSQETVSLIENVLRLFIRKDMWKGRRFVLSREGMQDYRTRPWDLSPKPVDFSCLTIKTRNKKLSIPFPCWDTVVSVIGADKKQRSQAEEYLRDAAVIFVGGPKPKDAIPVILDAYDADILTELKASAPQIGALCRLWQEEQPVEALDGFADDVYAALPSSADRLRPVKPDSDALREAVFATVRKVFLGYLVDSAYISPNEAAGFLNSLAEPDPMQTEVPSELRNVSEPEVFLDVVRKMIAENADRIVGFDEKLSAVKDPLGAWRSIGDADHFVMLEETFEKEFPKACKEMGDIDLSFFTEGWRLNLQKQLKPAKVMKTSGSSYRYRYALVQGRKRDDTYVIAIPQDLLVETREEVGA